MPGSWNGVNPVCPLDAEALIGPWQELVTTPPPSPAVGDSNKRNSYLSADANLTTRLAQVGAR